MNLLKRINDVNQVKFKMTLLSVLYRTSIIEEKPGPSFRFLYKRSKSQDNYFRLCLLINTVCSDLLRTVLCHYIKPTELRLKLDENRIKLEIIFNHAQKAQIYSSAGKSLLSVDDLDISLLYCLLRNICNIPQHNNGWGNSPQKGDNSIAACIDIIRLKRNSILIHSRNGQVEETEFKKHWKDLRDVIEKVEKQISGATIFSRGADYLFDCELSGKEAEKYIQNFKEFKGESLYSRFKITNINLWIFLKTTWFSRIFRIQSCR